MEEKLSNFVQYKSLVDNISIDEKSLLSEIDNAVGIINNNKIVDTGALIKQKEKIQCEIEKLSELLGGAKQLITKKLRESEHKYLTISQKLYEIGRSDDAKYIKERIVNFPLFANENNKKLLLHELSLFVSWKYPGLIIRPTDDDVLNVFKSCDPLYIADEHNELLLDVKEKVNERYHNKLRFSTISDDDNVLFKKIPQKQIGLVYIHDFFNYKSVDMIKKYTEQIYNLLRSGGILMFTYNNCDLPNAVRNFENHLYTYTPASLLIPMLEMLGFELVKKYDDTTTNSNWIIVKKPGKLKSLRGGQTLAKLMNKNNLKD